MTARVIAHPLQPFSRRLFEGGKNGLFSYASAWVPAARPQAMSAFIASRLPEPEPEAWTLLRVEDLHRLLRNPARVLLRDRLRVHLEESEGLLPATEPFALDGLERYQLGRQAFTLLRNGVDPREARAIARAAGALPAGAAGDVVFGNMLADLAPLAARAGAAAVHDPITADLAVGGCRVVGTVRGGAAFEPAKLNAARRLGAWVRHLAVNAAAGPHATALYAIDDALAFCALDREAATAQLAALVALHRRALCEPLPFFPKSSLAFAECLQKGKPPQAALAEARKCWHSENGQSRGEDQDPYFALAFRHLDSPLDDAFARVAVEVCTPMLQAMEAAP